jgi:hypothetical protein
MKEALPECTIRTISEYNDIVFSTFSQWEAECGNGLPPHIWFRGQDRDDPLLPKVLRKVKDPDTGEECQYNEYYIHQAFSAIYANYTSERFQDRSSEYYSFMQHYGIPTRLLDWTENAILALYFAVSVGTYNENVQRVVWVMNPGALNRLSTGKQTSYAPLLSHVALVQLRLKIPGSVKAGRLTKQFIIEEIESLPSNDKPSIKDLRFPIAFWPSSSGNIRIAAQKGCFTIHGTDPQPIEPFFEESGIRKYLIKIKIQKESVSLLRKQLRIMGVTPMSVYPDLFGLSSELCSKRYMK